MDARRYVWEGAIPIRFELDPLEVTTMPAPPPLLVMASRNGYLPLLAPTIRPHFQGALPPGEDTLWFDYKGLPLKWHIPTGVLFDMLCIEPERPWPVTVHFRAYPSELMAPYEGTDAVKWSFMNTLKEASYIIRGNTKNVMELTQNDQNQLWSSIVKGDMDEHDRIAVQFVGPGTSGKVPMRLYVRVINGSSDDTFSTPPVRNWNEVMIMTRPVEIPKQDQVFTLGDALLKILPQYFNTPEESAESKGEDDSPNRVSESGSGVQFSGLVRIQGIEPSLDLPFEWIAKNLSGQEHFTHVCMWVFQE